MLIARNDQPPEEERGEGRRELETEVEHVEEKRAREGARERDDDGARGGGGGEERAEFGEKTRGVANSGTSESEHQKMSTG